MIFPRWSEQRPVEKSSYQGYFLPKCMCNAINLHTFLHIHIKHACLYMIVYMSCPISRSSLSPSQMHMSSMYENYFKTKAICFLNSLDILRFYNKVDNPPNFDIIISIGQPSDMILYCTGHSPIVQYTGQSSELNIKDNPPKLIL